MTNQQARDAERDLLMRSFTAINHLMGLVEGLRIGAGIENKPHPEFIIGIEADLQAHLIREAKP